MERIKRHYRPRIKSGHIGIAPNAHKAPRPAQCDLDTCSKDIGADEPYYTDRTYPLIFEVQGEREVFFREKVPHFCSAECRTTHRYRFLSRCVATRTQPSP
jgi:hypothetical protein